MFKNVRYLYNVLGTTDISAIGDGTVKGAIATLNSNLTWNIIEDEINKIYCKYLTIGAYCIVFITHPATNVSITSQYGNLYFAEKTLPLSALNLPILNWELINVSVISSKGLIGCSVMRYSSSDLTLYLTNSKSENISNISLQIVGVFMHS